jgi:hypothetical protein
MVHRLVARVSRSAVSPTFPRILSWGGLSHPDERAAAHPNIGRDKDSDTTGVEVRGGYPSSGDGSCSAGTTRTARLTYNRDLSGRVVTLLRRCIQEDANPDGSQFINQLTQRSLPELFVHNPWRRSLDRIPEDQEPQTPNGGDHENASLRWIKQLSPKLDHLIFRDPASVGSPDLEQTLPPERPGPIATRSSSSSITSVITILWEVRTAVREALEEADFKNIALFQPASSVDDTPYEPTQAVQALYDEWVQCNNWATYKLTHPDYRDGDSSTAPPMHSSQIPPQQLWRRASALTDLGPYEAPTHEPVTM